MTKEKRSNIVDGQFFWDMEPEVISISPALDILLGGGIVSGTWNTIYGPPKFGKTALALRIAAKCQEMGKMVYYGNVEARLKRRDLISTSGLKPELFKVVTSRGAEFNEKNELAQEALILTAEGHIAEYENLLKNGHNSCLIIDSESYLCTNAEMEGDITDMQRADAAKLMAKFVRRNKDLICFNNWTVIVIRHIAANPTGYGAPTKEKGSNAGNYQTDVKLRGDKVEEWKEGDDIVGQIMSWKLETGALPGAVKGTSIQSYFRFGYGIDEEAELANLAIELGLASVKTPWYTYGEKKYQGLAKFTAGIKESSELKNELQTKLRELVGQ